MAPSHLSHDDGAGEVEEVRTEHARGLSGRGPTEGGDELSERLWPELLLLLLRLLMDHTLRLCLLHRRFALSQQSVFWFLTNSMYKWYML